MTTFREMYGVVYILENVEAQRVKIGMTINDVTLRLRDANDMWLEHKLTCQVCGTRRLASVFGTLPRLMPKHLASGESCLGSNSLPLEADDALAKHCLEQMKARVGSMSGTAKGSMVRKVNKLDARLKLRSQHTRGIGTWQINMVFYTECAEAVELRSHELLRDRLDRSAPLGEVFRCSPSEARDAVEAALEEFGLRHAARREEPRRASNARDFSL